MNFQINGLYFKNAHAGAGFRIVKKTRCFITIVECDLIHKIKDGVETYTLIEYPSSKKRYKIFENPHEIYINTRRRTYFKSNRFLEYELTDETKVSNTIVDLLED